MESTKNHWDKVYSNPEQSVFTWTIDIPTTSLLLMDLIHLPKTASIIDIGGGDSKFVDHLISLGFKNISVLDISENAIKRAQSRLGDNAESVNWIVSDINEFKPDTTYDLWHDRATFHFLKSQQEIEHYYQLAHQAIKNSGYLILSTFSDNGPDKCSGLEVSQYNNTKLTEIFGDGFDRVKCMIEDHITPTNKLQNFIYCLFKNRIDNSSSNHNTAEDEYVNNKNQDNPDVIVNSNMFCDIRDRGNCCS